MDSIVLTCAVPSNSKAVFGYRMQVPVGAWSDCVVFVLSRSGQQTELPAPPFHYIFVVVILVAFEKVCNADTL